MKDYVQPMEAESGLAEYVGAMINASRRDDMGLICVQKAAYILQAKAVGFWKIHFDYHKYGPFSPKVAIALDDAEALGYIRADTREEHEEHPVPYTVFLPAEDPLEFAECDETDKIRGILDSLRTRSMFELELATAAIYFRKNGHENDYIEEVEKRKSLRPSDSRMKHATELLSEIQI